MILTAWKLPSRAPSSVLYFRMTIQWNTYKSEFLMSKGDFIVEKSQKRSYFQFIPVLKYLFLQKLANLSEKLIFDNNQSVDLLLEGNSLTSAKATFLHERLKLTKGSTTNIIYSIFNIMVFWSPRLEFCHLGLNQQIFILSNSWWETVRFLVNFHTKFTEYIASRQPEFLSQTNHISQRVKRLLHNGDSKYRRGDNLGVDTSIT